MLHKPVRCVETGEVWPSRKECYEAIGVTAKVLQERMKFRETIDGCHYVNA